MRFVYAMGSILPADAVAAAYLAQSVEGAEFELTPIETQRSPKQNKSLWVYCAKLAKALNDAGFDMRTYPWKEGLSIPFTKNSIMDLFWRPVQNAMLGTDSTKELTTKTIQSIYEALDEAMFQRTGIRVNWPCIDSQMREAQERKVA